MSVSGIGVSVSGAEDLAGNLQVPLAAQPIQHRHAVPMVTGLQANPVLIADAAVPSGFSLVVSYSEAMKAAQAPTITFSPDVSSTLHFTSGTWNARREAVHGELQRYGRWGERFRNRGECERAEDWPATFRSPSRSPTYSASTRRTRR